VSERRAAADRARAPEVPRAVLDELASRRRHRTAPPSGRSHARA
jgi:hypothetical protein